MQVQTAAASEDEADRLSAALLERRLAACVQVVGPVRSRYWWHGALESADEWLCLVKTTEERVDDVVRALRAAHSYDTPEIVVVAVVDGDDDYLDWIVDTVDQGPADGRVGPS